MRFSASFYQSILDNMSNAYSYHRIITDEKGEAVDFEFIQVNPALEQIIGKPANHLIGRTAQQIEPVFFTHHKDLLKIFAEVALQGASRTFERHFPNRDKWYSISTYSPQPGFFITLFNDITTIKKTEQKLRESEARWKYALEGAGDGIWDYDISAQKVFFSSQWKTMLGYADDEISDSLYEWYNRLHPEDLLNVQSAMADMQENTHDYYSLRFRMRCQDGSYKWFLGRGKVVSRDHNGNPRRIIGTNSDISEAKAAEAALKQTEENLMSFFNGVDSMLFVIDGEGNIREANLTALQTLGYCEKEIVSQNILDLELMEDRIAGAKFLRSLLSGKKFNRTLTLVNKTRDNWISVDVRMLPGTWNGEQVLFAICRDITELRLSEAKFFRAFHINPAIMTITTLEEGFYIDVNKSFCHLLEYERKEVLGHNSLELGIYEDISQRNQFINIVKTEGRVRDFEIALRSRSGKRIIGSLSSDIIRIGTDSYLLTNVSNITEHRLLEQELEKKNQELEELNRVLQRQASTDDLTAIYNHRFILQRLREEVERSDRYSQPLSIMMLDLDHFKSVNDRFAHQTGDIVLYTVAQTIKKALRHIDVAGRYGGEEFLVILPQTTQEDAVQVAERIREQVEGLFFDDKNLKITISIGVTFYRNENERESELLARADHLLYQAKDNGRNRVEY